MADAGIDDIFICYPIIGRQKLERLGSLNKRLNRLIVEVESLEGGLGLSAYAQETNQTFNVICEVDNARMNRTGFEYETAVQSILEVSKMPGICVIGIFAYAYMTMRDGIAGSPEEAGVAEGKLTVALAEKLRAAGLALEIVGGGSTPTGRYVATVPGITEVHPGTYVYYDTMSSFFGITSAQCAAYVVATVVASNEKRACIDGGSKTFSTDLPIDCEPLRLEGYGRILGREDLRLDHLSEEHGIVVSKDGKPTNLPIGTKLRIIPNHICPCVALHDYVYFAQGDTLEKVRIEGRGKLE
jgi:D-serine deaminase-like pyridoxal phosphate-dependent protein